MNPQAPRGFVALISTLIIATALTGLAMEASKDAYYARLSVLHAAYAEGARLAARTCTNIALLRLAQDISYKPPPNGETVPLGKKEGCRIDSIIEMDDTYIINSSSLVKESFSSWTIRIYLDDGVPSIIHSREI